MNERLRSHPAQLNSIRWVISGGAPVEPEVGREFAMHSGALVERLMSKVHGICSRWRF